MKKNKLVGIVLVGALSFSLAACGSEQTVTESTSTVESAASQAEVAEVSELFSERDTEVTYSESEVEYINFLETQVETESEGVAVEGTTATITKEGIYVVSGASTNGQIIVEVADTEKVQLVIQDLTLEHTSSAPIYVRQADKVFLTLEGTNTLATTGEYVAIDDNNIDAVVFAKSDLTLNGTGSLNVETEYGHGIVTKDDLKVTGGTYSIAASSHGLVGKDLVALTNAEIEIVAGKDGIQSEHEEAEKGCVYLVDGSVRIEAVSDGISASNTIQVFGGSYEMSVEDDGIHSDGSVIIEEGTIQILKSYEGIEGEEITINGGVVDVVSSDDGLNATESTTETTTESTTESTTEATTESTAETAKEEIEKMPEGEAATELPTDETRPAGGKRQAPTQEGSEAPQMPTEESSKETSESRQAPSDQFNKGGGQGGAASETAKITVNGGTLSVNADGDGIDSNGSLEIHGGTVYINGSTNGGNGALDYAGTGVITGGTVIAVSAQGMNQGLSSDSTQGSILYNLSSGNTNESNIVLKDETGSVILEYTPEKSFGTVLLSSSEIEEGKTYTLEVAGSTEEITMDGTTYSNGQGSGMGRF